MGDFFFLQVTFLHHTFYLFMQIEGLKTNMKKKKQLTKSTWHTPVFL